MIESLDIITQHAILNQADAHPLGNAYAPDAPDTLSLLIQNLRRHALLDQRVELGVIDAYPLS